MRARSDGSDNDITKDETGKISGTKKGSSLPRDAELRLRAESARPSNRDDQMEFVSLIPLPHWENPGKIWLTCLHLKAVDTIGYYSK